MVTIRTVAVLLVLSVAAQAQSATTVEQLTSFIQSSVKMKLEDRKVAEYVQKMKLTNRLDDRTVEDLQGMGAGPKTVAALRQLSAGSASLPPPAPPKPKPTPVYIPPPSEEEQQKILAQIKEYAANYTKSLPNYICTQVTRRHYDPSGTEAWRLADTIQEQLSYFEQKESYKVVMVNGKMVENVQHDKLGGATSSGEFGTMLSEIFNPETQTEFSWDHWATLRGRKMYVFGFRVQQTRSKYTIYHNESRKQITTGYHGTVYADSDTGMVMRIKMQCDDIPPDFPIQSVALDMNYDYTKISEQEFVLPLKFEIRSREGKQLVWNEASYHLYRKFGADAKITFETPEAIPDDKTKEEPVPTKPPTKK